MNAKGVILILLCAVVLIFASYFYSISQVSVESVSVDSLSDVDLSGFTLEGDVLVHNGGFLPVGVDGIDYKVVIRNSTLSQGSVKGGWIMPGQKANYSFSSRIEWVPTGEALLSLLIDDKTYATIQGNITLSLLGMDFSIPFEKNFDIKEYLIQFATKKAEKYLGKGLVEAGKKIVQGFFG